MFYFPNVFSVYLEFTIYISIFCSLRSQLVHKYFKHIVWEPEESNDEQGSKNYFIILRRDKFLIRFKA